MDFTEIITLLKKASLYDIYRITDALKNEMEDPEKITALRQCFAVGSTVSYFNGRRNSLSQGVVLQKNLKKIVIRDLQDNEEWNVPYFMINLTQKDSTIRAQPQEKLTKNHLKINDCVGFNYDGKQYIGNVDRLNHKTVTLTTRENKCYRISYGMLFKFIDGEIYTSSIGNEYRGKIIEHD